MALAPQSTDVYDEMPLEGGDAPSQHWLAAAYERERPAPVRNLLQCFKLTNHSYDHELINTNNRI